MKTTATMMMMGFYLLLPMNGSGCCGCSLPELLFRFFRGFYDFFTIFIAVLTSLTLLLGVPLPGLGKLMFPPVFKQKRVRKRTIKKPSNEKLPNTPLINRYSSSSELASSLELPDDPNVEVFMTFLIHKLSKSH